ncbi:hypothetical protein [Bradyrhizobium sp. ERR14]|uniref:hypothetical protein n=1 Tax=Bradyrhizobium sp. ERR14 TaxID=2663837 RepID=UPI001621F191|nr:hypothetical protein [Bradyrhizobium sp. ERR14]MBB4396520.1 hypothetical protein [Bradyrhizobium sp. ERR14]
MNDRTAYDLGFDFGQIGRIDDNPLRALPTVVQHNAWASAGQLFDDQVGVRRECFNLPRNCYSWITECSVWFHLFDREARNAQKLALHYRNALAPSFHRTISPSLHPLLQRDVSANDLVFSNLH